MNRQMFFAASPLLLVASHLPAQQPPGGYPPQAPPPGYSRAPNPPPQQRPNNQPSPQDGAWWRDPMMVRRLGLTQDQQRRIEGVFQQNRAQLMSLDAALGREESILDPMLSADRPDPNRVLPQVDRVADARAALEKANGRMLLGVRTILSADQWRRLQSDPGPPQTPPR